MLQKQKIRLVLVAGLSFISLGGWLLHLRIHPPAKFAAGYVPFVAGLLSITCVCTLFLFRRTRAYAYVINGMLVIVGIITMAHFSWAHPPERVTFVTIFFNTLFPDVLVLLANFMLGKALFELETVKAQDTPARRGRFWRYPNNGWWLVHLVSLSTVYTLGHFVWQ